MARQREFVFRATLARDPTVRRKAALSAEQTLEDLHELLREEFGWDDPHLYAFWLSGRFWDRDETEYTAPFELEESSAKSAQTPLGALELRDGQKIAYVFDFGDQWEVEIVVEAVGDAAGAYPRVLERVGEAPPQYPDYDDEE